MDSEPREMAQWLALFDTAAGVGVTLVSSDRIVLYHNREIARLYKNNADLDLRGRSLSELFPPAWVEQRDAILGELGRGAAPVVLRSIMHGRQIEATLRGIPNEDGVVDRILVVVHAGETPDAGLSGGVRIVESDTVDLGQLGVLTPRELEVLSLIGCGHSAKEIGELLGCSHRTVERHRDSIGKKLDVQDRVALATIARAAGLQLRDAQRQRIDTRARAEGREGTIEEPKPQARASSTKPRD